ncbi:MAG: aspartate-semialdehyde dehydrogenase [Candidatus Gracilibacteria bacterium]|nr:aspartate-semialdehyde dehydrogenase [Candidatus Gracilibacteria bacterium]
MYNIGIVGATGAVGIEMINCLYELKIPIKELKLGASINSAGKILKTQFGEIAIKEVNEDFFEGLDYALFSAGGDNSKLYAPIANKKGVIVIDNSSAFRYDENIPLIVPQINPEAIKDAMIIANPNCTTAIAGVAIYPIYKKYGLKKMIVSTYQATSGAGAKGMDELIENTKKYLNNEERKVNVFTNDIAFNLIPHIDKFQDNGYTKEEMKVTWETHKIFGDNNIKISCTAVRIPTLRAHSESIVLETEKEVDIEDIKKIINEAPGVELVDDIKNNKYPMPKNATGKYDVEVGRIRKNLVFGDYGVELFVSGDQLLRGAALNAVEILKIMIDKNIGQ